MEVLDNERLPALRAGWDFEMGGGPGCENVSRGSRDGQGLCGDTFLRALATG